MKYFICACFFLCVIVFADTYINQQQKDQSEAKTVSSISDNLEVYHEFKEYIEVDSEMELAKKLYENAMNGILQLKYVSNKNLDINKTVSYLGLLVPYDVSLKQKTLHYDDNSCNYNTIDITNLDGDDYVRGEKQAKQLIRQLINESMDNKEKIEVIHDYLSHHVTYDYETEEKQLKQSDAFHIYGALINHRAVCTGYSRAFMILAYYADIPAMYVASDQMNHSWNLVYDGETWRYLDVTWDAQNIEYGLTEKYKNMSIEEFLKDGDHKFDNYQNSSFYLNLAKFIFDDKR